MIQTNVTRPSSGIQSFFNFSNGWGLLLAPIQAKIHYIDREECLLSEKISQRPIESFLKGLDQIKSSGNRQVRVFHFMYECGFLFIDRVDDISSDQILCIELLYPHWQRLCSDKVETDKIVFQLKNKISKKDYKKAFDLGKEYLRRGDCYQYNLTYPFDYSYRGDLVSHFLSSKENLGLYAHGTILGLKNLSFLSNSPESLFSWKKNKITSLPIKGTISCSQPEDISSLWARLAGSEKDQAELYMICDMVRNDLNRIDRPRAIVLEKKMKLLVSGLIHSASLLECELSSSVSLLKVMSSLFPGASITGAPKKRVMAILSELESSARNFYCGSTVLVDASGINASINIRSLEFDPTEESFRYHGGGGITFQSEWEAEYQEMLSKVESFLSALRDP